MGKEDAPEETEQFSAPDANPCPEREAERRCDELLAIGERLNRQQSTLGAVTIPVGQSAREQAARILPPDALKHAVEAGRVLLVKLEQDDREKLVF